jgi:hypothetical protein
MSRRESIVFGLLIIATILFLCMAILIQLGFDKDKAITLYVHLTREEQVTPIMTSPTDSVVNNIEQLVEDVVVTPVAEANQAVDERVGQYTYIEVVDSCEHDYTGECLRVRSGPGLEFTVVSRLRVGMVLQSEDKILDKDGNGWHKVVFNEWLRYPDRVSGDWYVSDKYVEVFKDDGTIILDENTATTTKHILIDRSEQKIFAYDGEEVVMEFPVSTGLEFTPTPRGTFSIFKKTPSRYMQGPLPYLSSQDSYDLPGVPWNLYFTEQGAVVHGAYWHQSFGARYSHGCVNLNPNNAEELYYWTPVGTRVVVQD